MTADDLLKEVYSLNSAEREKFYLNVMEGYFKSMMSNQKFMEEAFNCMASYLSEMKKMGLDVNSILTEMEAGLGMKNVVAA